MDAEADVEVAVGADGAVALVAGEAAKRHGRARRDGNLLLERCSLVRVLGVRGAMS